MEKQISVIAINGSPNTKGNTYHALKLVCDELEKEGIKTEIISIGNKRISGCLACNGCLKNKDEKCIINGDDTNKWIAAMKEADGILLGSPVHFASMAGNMKSFLDRAFYVAGVNKSMFRHKVGASVVAVRRTGGMPAFNEMNNFLTYSEMMIPTSNYWNIIHGTLAGEVLEDDEGKQIMRVLGKNMAYLLKIMDKSKSHIEAPAPEKKIFTHFVR